MALNQGEKQTSDESCRQAAMTKYVTKEVLAITAADTYGLKTSVLDGDINEKSMS